MKVPCDNKNGQTGKLDFRVDRWERFRRMRRERERERAKMIQIKFFFCRHPRNWGIGRGLKRGSQDSLCVYSLACCAITRSTTHTQKKGKKRVGRVQRDGQAIPAIPESAQPRRTDSPFTWTGPLARALIYFHDVMTYCWCTHVSAYMRSHHSALV